MSFLVGIILGIIIAILILIFIMCIAVLTTLEYAGTHIDNLANTIRFAIEKGKEAAKNRKEENKKNVEGGAANENAANQSAPLVSNFIYSEDKGRYILK